MVSVPVVQTNLASSQRAQAVVIGGGITGTSVAYHLAKAGITDVLLVEKGELTSGSTCHAAGLVTQFNASPTMMRFRRYSVELYNELGVFETMGSLRIASSEESLKELQRGASRARGIGLDVEVLGPREALELMPAASPEDLFGAVWIAADGCVDPHTATYALADAARALGVRIQTHTRVTGIELDHRRAVSAVVTEAGRIETELVINACGMWAPQVSAMVGAFTPSVPVDHQHIALLAVPGHELPNDMPCFRDTDNLVYGRSESGGVLFGGYEPNPAARWVDGVPWDHSEKTLPADPERFEQLMQGAARRFPFLDDAGVVALVCHPDAMTPDGNPLLGEMPGVPGLLGGRRALAERLRRRRRHGPHHRRVDHHRRDRARHPRLPRVEVWCRLPQPAPGGGGRARGLQVLLPPALPAGHRRVGPAQPAPGRCTSGCRTRAPCSA